MIAFFLLAASFTIPAEVKQGDTLRIEGAGAANLSAQLGSKRVRLFPADGGAVLGLMPIPVDQKPGAVKLQVLDAAGAVVHEAEVTVLDSHFPVQDIAATSQMKALKPLPGEMEAIRALQQAVSDQRFWSDPFQAPVAGCMNGLFGVQRYHNGEPTGNFHRGVDQRGAAGTPVKATADGVVRVSNMYRLHGGTIGIDHGQGVVSLYIHLSRLALPAGAKVKRGDVVGYVGSTGFATGPHLHWAIYVNGLPVNPLQWTPGVRSCK